MCMFCVAFFTSSHHRRAIVDSALHFFFSRFRLFGSDNAHSRRNSGLVYTISKKYGHTSVQTIVLIDDNNKKLYFLSFCFLRCFFPSDLYITLPVNCLLFLIVISINVMLIVGCHVVNRVLRTEFMKRKEKWKQREHNEKSSLWARIVIVSREEANTIYLNAHREREKLV